jgi:hypothetical protein
MQCRGLADRGVRMRQADCLCGNSEFGVSGRLGFSFSLVNPSSRCRSVKSMLVEDVGLQGLSLGFVRGEQADWLLKE